MDLIRKIAKAETIHLHHQSLALQSLYPEAGYTTKHVAESITLLSPSSPGRKLNHTYGFGSFGPVTTEDLRAIEDACEQIGVRPELDMCEYADTSALGVLSAEYAVTGSLCEFQISLAEYRYRDVIDQGIDICILDSDDDHDLFIKASVEGFSSTGRSTELLKVLAESAAARSDTLLFSASVDGNVLGTAAMAIIQAEKGSRMAVLYLDSCLPSAQGQKASTRHCFCKDLLWPKSGNVMLRLLQREKARSVLTTYRKLDLRKHTRARFIRDSTEVIVSRTVVWVLYCSRTEKVTILEFPNIHLAYEKLGTQRLGTGKED